MDNLLTAEVIEFLNKVINVVLTGLVSIAIILMKSLGSQFRNMCIDIDNHRSRIDELERSSITRDDLNEVMLRLQQEIHSGFQAATKRIDDLYNHGKP